jgi:acyl-CoA synthetase (NDP forming)
VVATVLGAEPPAELASIPAYRSPEGAVMALSRAVAYAEWRAEPVGTVPELPVRTGAARALLAGVTGRLDDSRCAELLACYGVDVVPTVAVASADEAVAAAGRLGWPVALKARAKPYRHHPETAGLRMPPSAARPGHGRVAAAGLGGQRLDIADEAALRADWASLAAQVGASGPFAVQRMVPAGVPVVIGSVEHPRYGPLVSFGLAGPATDLLGDRVHHILPLTDVEAGRLVRSARAAPLLFGYRGSTPVDVGALEQLLLRIARLADDLPDVASLTLDPVLVCPEGLWVLSAEAVVGAPRPRADAGPRRYWVPNRAGTTAEIAALADGDPPKVV